MDAVLSDKNVIIEISKEDAFKLRGYLGGLTPSRRKSLGWEDAIMDDLYDALEAIDWPDDLFDNAE